MLNTEENLLSKKNVILVQKGVRENARERFLESEGAYVRHDGRTKAKNARSKNYPPFYRTLQLIAMLAGSSPNYLVEKITI